MSFKETFIKYFDMALTGFIGGFVVYIMVECSKNIKGILIPILTFIILLLLVLIYSFCVWFFNKK